MAKKTTRRTASERTVEVDFTGIAGGGGFLIPDGEYQMRCEEVKKGVSQNDNEQFEWIFKGLEGKSKGKTFYFYTPLVSQALWKLRETLVALGQEVPEGPMDIDLNELEGCEGTGIVESEDYRGKDRSKLVGFVTNSTAVNKPEPKIRSKKVVKMSEEEVKDMSEEDLEALVEKYGLEIDLSDYKILRRKTAAVIEALGEADLLEEA